MHLMIQGIRQELSQLYHLILAQALASPRRKVDSDHHSNQYGNQP